MRPTGKCAGTAFKSEKKRPGMRSKRTLLLDALSLAGLGALGDGLAEHCHEGRILVPRPAGELAELMLGAQLGGGLPRVVEDL